VVAVGSGDVADHLRLDLPDRDQLRQQGQPAQRSRWQRQRTGGERGALGVGAYAYYDTGQVAATAIEMFESEMTIEETADADAATTAKPKPAPKPKPAAKAAQRVAGKLVDEAVATAARKVAGAAQKAAGKTRKKKPDPPQRG
jgi:hypothetical protein